MIYFASFVRKRLCAKNHFMSRPIARRLLSDSAAYMLNCGKLLKSLYPKMKHVTCLEAALFYAEQYSEVKYIVLSFEDDGLIVSEAKSAISHADLKTELILVCEYPPLVELVLKMESQDFQISQAYSTISHFQENPKSLDPAGILEYSKARLQINPDLSEIIEGNGNLSPAEYSKLRKAQPSSGDVERSFSKLNHLLADDRNFLEDNIEQYIVCYANNMD